MFPYCLAAIGEESKVMSKKIESAGSPEKGTSKQKLVSTRRSIRPGYEHLAGLYKDKHIDVMPDTDEGRLDKELDTYASCA
jgi:uncharacterized lipoprotein NlpE involved in copper resistance